MTRSRSDAQAWARKQIKDRDQDWLGMCQKFVRTAFDVGGGFGSAIAQWNGAKKKHGQTDLSKIPLYVPIFWKGGKHGHVAIYIGNGMCISTDGKRNGWPDIVTVKSLSRKWNYTFLGWTEDLNGTQVYFPEKEKPAGLQRVGAQTVKGFMNLYKLEQDFKKSWENPSNPNKAVLASAVAKGRGDVSEDQVRRTKFTLEGDYKWLLKNEPGKTKTHRGYINVISYLDWLLRNVF